MPSRHERGGGPPLNFYDARVNLIAVALAVLTSGCILWSADHETGDTSQWTADTWGRISISSTADAQSTTAQAHSGTRSLALTVYGAYGGPDDPGVRMVREGAQGAPLPADSYYSVWYYFPQVVETPNWWNVFPWKRKHGPTEPSDPVLIVNVTN